MFITRITYYNLLRLFTYFADKSIQVHEFDMRFPIAQSDASDGQEDAPIRDRSALWPGGVIPYEYGNSISEYKLISYLMFVVFDVWVYIHTGQAEKYTWPRWESNLRPLEC